jgi:hypothetical protein
VAVNVLELLLRALLVGATAAGLVHAVRTLPPVERLVQRGVKPWACDVCMSFWCTLLVVGASGLLGLDWLLAAAPAYPVALFVTRQLGGPSSLPPPPE